MNSIFSLLHRCSTITHRETLPRRSWRTGSFSRPQCFAVTMSGCVLDKWRSSLDASQIVCMFPTDYTTKSVYLCDVSPKCLARDTVDSKCPTMHWFSCIVLVTRMLLHFQSFLGHLNRTQSVLTSLVTSELYVLWKVRMSAVRKASQRPQTESLLPSTPKNYHCCYADGKHFYEHCTCD